MCEKTFPGTESRVMPVWLLHSFFASFFQLAPAKTSSLDFVATHPFDCRYPESDYKLFVKRRCYPGARLERYLQNGAIIRRLG